MDNSTGLKRIIVTIDGPAGSGKSTTASKLASRIGFTYLDTGAMYRAVTWAALSRGIDPHDEEKVCALAADLDLEMKVVDGVPVVFVDGEETGSKIRTLEVSNAVSPVSSYAAVREILLDLQRTSGAGGGIVAEGRDTGTTVFPYAEVKVFLTADIEARAQRRVAQMVEMGMDPDIDQIRENIAERDRIDSGREHSPLRKPPGSLIVDTSGITIEEQVELIEKKVLEESGRISALAVGRGEKNEAAGRRLYWRISRNAVYLIFRLIFGLRVRGSENLRFRENFIFASNHISYADPPLVGCALNREIAFMAKVELFRNPLLGWLIRKYHAFPVKRGAADRRSIKEIHTRLGQGQSVLLFPEGTRSRTGKTAKLKSGLGMVALGSQKTIIPVFIKGANRLKRCMLRKERLEVGIGRPIRIMPGYESDDRRADYEILAGMVAESMRILDAGKTT